MREYADALHVLLSAHNTRIFSVPEHTLPHLYFFYQYVRISILLNFENKMV